MASEGCMGLQLTRYLSSRPFRSWYLALQDVAMKVPQQMLFLATGASAFSGSTSSGSAASSLGPPSFRFRALLPTSFCLLFSACTRCCLSL